MPPNRYLKLAAPLFVTCFSPWLAPYAVAQDVLLDFVGLSHGDESGHAIAVADWDADGIEDLAVATFRDSTAAPQAGAVYVRSGKDGSASELFGLSVAAVDDLPRGPRGAHDVVPVVRQGRERPDDRERDPAHPLPVTAPAPVRDDLEVAFPAWAMEPF